MEETDGDLIRIVNLRKYFPITSGVLRRKTGEVRAVDDVTLSIKRRETLGLVGESGCGKSTAGRLLLRLIEATGGEIWFEGRDVAQLNSKELRKLRREMQIIFQDPYSSLHPRRTVEQLISEPITFHGIYESASEVSDRVDELMNIVGLSTSHRHRYPHEFSGGQRQRIGIARGLSVNPKFVVCDEPISALDVSIQSQVLNLLQDLQRDFGLTYLFISHDLSVVRYISDRVAVMYLGKIVEFTDTEALFVSPQHPYTEALLSAIPVPDPTSKKERILLQGDVPSPSNPPEGCNFHPRCPYAEEICRTDEPPLREVPDDLGGKRMVACHFAEELSLKGVEAPAPVSGTE